MSSARVQVYGLESRASESLELLWPKYIDDGGCGAPSAATLRTVSDLAKLFTHRSDGLVKSLKPTTFGYRLAMWNVSLLQRVLT